MKKRITALVLVIAITLAFAIPVLADSEGTLFGKNDGNYTPWLEGWFVEVGVTTRTSIDDGEDEDIYTPHYYKSYAFAKTESDKLKWIAIKAADLTPDLWYMDVSKIVKDSGVLVLSSGTSGQAETTADIKKIKSGEGEIDYAVIPVSGVAQKPSKPTLEFDDMDVYFKGYSELDLENGKYEWTFANCFGWWNSVTKDGLRFGNSTKVDIWIRTAAAENGLPSAPIKVGIPAVPAPPKVSVNGTKGEIKVKPGWEVHFEERINDEYRYTRIDYTAILDCPVLKWDMEGGDNKIKDVKASVYYPGIADDARATVTSMTSLDLTKCNDSFTFVIPSSAKGPSSSSGYFYLYPNEEPYEENFAMAAKQQIMVVNMGNDIEAKIGGKWKKIKKLTLSQIPDDGLPVRCVGMKYSFGNEYVMPSEVRYLKWDKEERCLYVEDKPGASSD